LHPHVHELGSWHYLWSEWIPWQRHWGVKFDSIFWKGWDNIWLPITQSHLPGSLKPRRSTQEPVKWQPCTSQVYTLAIWIGG
jgi:hypothetical protein